MPLDGMMNTAFLNRATLIQALRNPEEYAPDWNFSHYDYCAVAVARRLGLPTVALHPFPTNPEEFGVYSHEVIDTMAAGYGLDPDDVERIFTGRWPASWPVPLEKVTPAMVADRLEAAPFTDERSERRATNDEGAQVFGFDATENPGALPSHRAMYRGGTWGDASARSLLLDGATVGGACALEAATLLQPG